MSKSLRTLASYGSAALAFVVLAAGPVAAQTIGENTSSSSFGIGAGQQRFAQIVTAPNERLTTFSLALSGASFTFVPEVYAWNGTAITGPALYTGSAQTITNGAEALYTFNTGSVAVTPGQTYALVVTQDGPNGGAIYYAQAGSYAFGDLQFGGTTTTTDLNTTGASTQDARFSATFVAAPAPAAVPTLSEWALIFFGVILAGGAALYVQKRQLEA